jgi:hypothetical protein
MSYLLQQNGPPAGSQSLADTRELSEVLTGEIEAVRTNGSTAT